MQLTINKPFRIFSSIVLTNVLIIAMVGILIYLNLFEKLKTDFLFAHSMYFTLGVLNTIVLFILIIVVDKKNPLELGFGLTKKDGVFSLLATALSLICVLSFIFILDQLNIVVAQFTFERVLTIDFYRLLGIAMIGWFFAALKEEVLARGYFMLNLTRFSIVNMILISAVLFMALHFVMGDFDPFKAASWFKGGIVYAYIYLKSGSLTVTTIVHAAHNLVNDLVIHGSEGALVLLNTKVTTADKLFYEVGLSIVLLVLTYLFYGKNGLLTSAENLKKIWNSRH